MKKVVSILATLSLLLPSCSKENPPVPEKPYDRVLVLYACGFVNLAGYIRNDIEELCTGSYIPEMGSRNAVLVFEHLTAGYADYNTPQASHLIRLYKNGETVVRDTIWKTNPASTADPDIMECVLQYVKGRFEAEHYNLIFNGHGTAWLPQDCYNTEARTNLIESYSNGEDVSPSSFGQERFRGHDYFLDITDMAERIPMHIDNLFFDACLMGNIESLYQLRKVADNIGASPTETQTKGFDYRNVARHLLEEKTPNPAAICAEMHEQYKNESGWYASNSITLVRTSALEKLAGVTASLIDKYRSEIDALSQDEVQTYENDEHPWFFDLEDIFIKAGADNAELLTLTEAVNKCILYRAISPEFFHIKAEHCCGISMALPRYLSDKLTTAYKPLEWNKATGYIAN